jgi:hypothetical protein
MTLHPIPLNFLIYEETIIFFFISAHGSERGEGEECAGGGERERGGERRDGVSLSMSSLKIPLLSICPPPD